VLKSIDGGGSWSPANTGLTNTDVRALAIDPVTPSTVYAGAARVHSEGGVFKSVDGGGSWSEVNIGLIIRDVRALVIDPVTPSTVYAGLNFFGVRKSVDGGGSWSDFSTGLTNANVRALAIDPATPSTLYAGTNGGGVFSLEQINGTINGLASKAICKNKVTAQRVKNSFTPPNWDCGRLVATSGDTVLVTLKGKSDGSAITGTVKGLDPVTKVKCKNRTTGAKARGNVSLPNWDCGSLPLPTSGDRVQVKLKGSAE